jgi:hypothetical protein
VQETRRQHTVSRFYLKGFADDREQIARLALPGGERITLSIRDATVIKDFYSVELPNGERSDMFERMFADIEAPASRALDAVLGAEWPLQAQSKEDLGTWVALQHLRSEELRASQNHMGAEFIRLIVGVSGKAALRGHIEAAEGRSISDEELDLEWRDLTKPGGPTLRANPVEHIRTIMELLPGFAAYLRDSHWTLHKFRRRALVTCDHPVSMARANREPWEGIGLATADVFCISLSRHVGLTIQPRARLQEFTSDPGSVPDFLVEGTTASANSINQQTVRGARRYVYLHPEDQLDARIRLPQPTGTSRMVTSDIDGLISEEGLFPAASYSTPAPQPPQPIDGGKGGMTLSDLPWPIPGRVRPNG